MFVRKPLRRKDKYPSFSAKTFGSDHALELNESEFSKGCFWARVTGANFRAAVGGVKVWKV